MKQKTIAQLKKEIATQRKRIAKEQTIAGKLSEKQKLNRELFELKNRKLIDAGAKAKRLSARLGKGILAIGKKAVPIVQKQARLIRDQQLRDDALARARNKQTTQTYKKVKLIKKRPKKTKIKKNNPKNNPYIFSNLDF